MTTLQKEIGKKITLEEFQTKLRKFVKQAFTEWWAENFNGIQFHNFDFNAF